MKAVLSYVKTDTANIDSDSIFTQVTFNWWHWLWPENADESHGLHEFKELAGLSVDVAMFLIDNRLEMRYGWGVLNFRRVQVKRLYSMHLNGPMDAIRIF